MIGSEKGQGQAQGQARRRGSGGLREAVLSLSVALAGLALGGSAGAAEAGSGGEVNVYSARHYDVDRQIYAAFEKETGIAVNLIEGNGDALLARIRAEGKRSPCDVLLTVDAGRLWKADEASLFRRVKSARLEGRLPGHLRHPEGHWFALSRRARCIFYSRERVDPAKDLSTYKALAEERWRGRVLVRSSSNIYNQSLVGMMIARDGAPAAERWAAGLVANFARKPQGGDTDQIRAVAAGEGDVAIANSYYYARLAKSEKPEDRAVVAKVGIFFPDQDGAGTHLNVSGAGVLETAPNAANAVAFLEFMVSDHAQELFAMANNEFPAVEGVALDPVLKGFGPFKADTTSAEAFGRLNRDAILLMNRAGWR